MEKWCREKHPPFLPALYVFVLVFPAYKGEGGMVWESLLPSPPKNPKADIA